jgi:hypothetical protein
MLLKEKLGTLSNEAAITIKKMLKYLPHGSQEKK